MNTKTVAQTAPENNTSYSGHVQDRVPYFSFLAKTPFTTNMATYTLLF